ncbi:MAG: RNA repair transcriptional activator RtcR family protein, partial [Klebsiella sp.]|nr:RNA repair transcriptional activator RtcR family protein [Klebsiella sp.]
MKKRRVVIGVLGTVLDKRGKRANRFKKWRPTVGLCQQADFPVDRLELLHQPRDESMAQKLIDDIAQLSPHTEVRPHTVEINDPWDFEEVYAAFLDFANRYRFDTENEEYLVHITTGTHVAQICWFLLTEARYLPASLLQTSPAPKSAADEAVAAGIYSVIDLDLSRYTALTSRFQREQQQSISFLKAGIETRNATFNSLIDKIERVALRSTAPILLTGPTGAGKSFLANRIYQLKQSRHQVSGKLVSVNCATLRGDNAMSTLFGHVKGAFTGAQSDKAGAFEAANGGMLFLDEVHRLDAQGQEKLFTWLDRKEIYRVGETAQGLPISLRLVFATTEDIHSTFLTTFLRRIPILVSLPDLQHRSREEKEALTLQFFWQEARTLAARLQLTPRLLQVLTQYVYRGNVGELKNVVKYAVASAWARSPGREML